MTPQINRIINAAESGDLVVIVGTGVSMSLTNGKNRSMSWTGLIENGLDYGVIKGKITPSQRSSWQAHVNSNDMDDLLSAAEFVGRKLDSPNGDLYGRWLQGVFSAVVPENTLMIEAIKALSASGARICTLNYDNLLEKVTLLPSISLGETSKVAGWMRKENHGILHLHGSWDSPSTCILGIRDYESATSNEIRNLIQRNLGAFSQLLFIGCGGTFNDPNFSTLIKWLRENLGTAALLQFALVSSSEMTLRHEDPSWHGFVEPISYGENFSDLSSFLLEKIFISSPKKRKPKKPVRKLPSDVHLKAISDYKNYILRDCGQITIEGVSTDMSATQGRFDLEKLFVPLQISPCAPEYPESDPRREEKLKSWAEKHDKNSPFGNIFESTKRLVLVALPGGGKTLLLKRIAVAYADRSRHATSNDSLPDIDVLPLMIRCREWREYIRKPIISILNDIGEITGQPNLKGLCDAILPLLKEGRVLLLVDGLDEIHNDGDRTTFVDNLESFLNEYKLVRLVVTSREVGFSLVAPSLARVCKLWRIAPLDNKAIYLLCEHWHRLMTGEALEGFADSVEVADILIENESLRRLAENPLLLTMLLVVKHGAGRLPPDRVSLYERAVEVLLDTWNIKGHDALNVKEAVPQLACVAYQMTLAGKQTATENELLRMLEEAREKVPQILRYAKNTPYEFLKRVELRSSLLVEAGHYLERGRVVPFYQFRHLTFQEYLTAVAVAEGHYPDYKKGDSVLTPLQTVLADSKWKEVIPMAAVLARKQAEPLLAALVSDSEALRLEGQLRLILPDPVARLMQCLVEEAETAPDTLINALQTLAYFAQGCTTSDDWRTLSRGPYGKELMHQVYLLYKPMQWPPNAVLHFTFAHLAVYRQPKSHWISNDGISELDSWITSSSSEDIIYGLMTLIGVAFFNTDDNDIEALSSRYNAIENHLYSDDPAIWSIACWAIGLIYNHKKSMPNLSTSTLDRIADLMFRISPEAAKRWPEFALYSQGGLPRGWWTPTLTLDQQDTLRNSVADLEEGRSFNIFGAVASIILAFHSGNVWDDNTLVNKIEKIKDSALTSKGTINSNLDKMIGRLSRKE